MQRGVTVDIRKGSKLDVDVNSEQQQLLTFSLTVSIHRCHRASEYLRTVSYSSRATDCPVTISSTVDLGSSAGDKIKALYKCSKGVCYRWFFTTAVSAVQFTARPGRRIPSCLPTGTAWHRPLSAKSYCCLAFLLTSRPMYPASYHPMPGISCPSPRRCLDLVSSR